jgi:hypothetical protein
MKEKFKKTGAVRKCVPWPVGLILLVLFFLGACGDDSDDEGAWSGEAVVMPSGMYDFYGTFSDNPIYADGSGRCAIPEPLGCPSVTNFCMYELSVGEPDGGGVQGIQGCTERPGEPSYDPACEASLWNVAVGKVYMMPFILSDWDGGGQVKGWLDTRGGRMDTVSVTEMVVERVSGLIPAWRIADWATALEGPTAAPPGSMVLTIPYQNNLKPPPPEGSPPGTYSPPASTTNRAVCRITNPEAGGVSHEASGLGLTGARVRLVTPHSILRTVIGIVPLGSDVMSVTAWDGAFCKRGDPATSCIPPDFPCPALHD